jgi:hypothetical protein
LIHTKRANNAGLLRQLARWPTAGARKTGSALLCPVGALLSLEHCAHFEAKFVDVVRSDAQFGGRPWLLHRPTCRCTEEDVCESMGRLNGIYRMNGEGADLDPGVEALLAARTMSSCTSTRARDESRRRCLGLALRDLARLREPVPGEQERAPGREAQRGDRQRAHGAESLSATGGRTPTRTAFCRHFQDSFRCEIGALPWSIRPVHRLLAPGRPAARTRWRPALLERRGGLGAGTRPEGAARRVRKRRAADCRTGPGDCRTAPRRDPPVYGCPVPCVRGPAGARAAHLRRSVGTHTPGSRGVRGLRTDGARRVPYADEILCESESLVGIARRLQSLPSRPKNRTGDRRAH